MRGSLARTDSRWWALKLSSMSTIIREWAAIHCVAHMPLREVLLTAQVGRGGCGGWVGVDKWMHGWVGEVGRAEER